MTRAWTWSFLEPVPECSVHSALGQSHKTDILGSTVIPPFLTPQADQPTSTQISLGKLMEGSSPHPPDRAQWGDSSGSNQPKASGHPKGTVAPWQLGTCLTASCLHPTQCTGSALGLGHIVGAYKMPAESITCWVPLRFLGHVVFASHKIVLKTATSATITEHLLCSVQFISGAQSCPNFCDPMTTVRQASLCITNSRISLKLMSIESMMPSSHLILCRPLLLLPSIFPSIRVFSNESALCIRWPKYWRFNFNISPSSEHPGLISFRMDLLDLPAVQGTLKNLLQHHSSNASILRRSAFFTVQLSHPYMTTGKTIALTRRTFVGKVMSLLFNTLSWSSQG